MIHLETHPFGKRRMGKMKILYNESLAKYTTFHIGGLAQVMYFPENNCDLASIPNLSNSRIIGAGSNLLINDNAVFKSVISTKELNKNVVKLENGNFFLGAGIRIQKAIASINKMGFGGLEYLVSIPASIGGMIYMNAGVFSPKPVAISDYLQNVLVFIDGNIEVWDKEKCQFSHRHSVFHRNKAIILGAEFKFPEQTLQISKIKIAERMAIAQLQDHSGGNCGSVFKVCNYKLMNILKKFHFRRGGVSYSEKSVNWIVNKKNGSYKDVKWLINLAIILHKLFLKKIEKEIIEWS